MAARETRISTTRLNALALRDKWQALINRTLFGSRAAVAVQRVAGLVEQHFHLLGRYRAGLIGELHQYGEPAHRLAEELAAAQQAARGPKMSSTSGSTAAVGGSSARLRTATRSRRTSGYSLRCGGTLAAAA